MFMRVILFPAIFFMFFASNAMAQNGKLFGVISDLNTKLPVDYATIYIEGTTYSTESDEKGFYIFEVPAGMEFSLVVSRLGYQKTTYFVKNIKTGEQHQINILLAPDEKDNFQILIRESKIEDVGMVREDVATLRLIPSSSGNFESILPNIALGTSVGAGGELSSQYNVRGGNYDENLVYVNDFEIFRPQLVKTGQQEGLSFPNIDLLKNLTFSSGGFESKYGDKMSSVLDVSYKRPDSLQSSVSFSLLGASGHLEGSKQLTKNKINQLRYLFGARYKTTQYLLNSLDVKGEYTPNFVDIQSYITYDISREWQIGWISNFNQSIYKLIPEEQTSAQGTFNQSYKFTSVFEGKERDEFINGMTGLSLTFLPSKSSRPAYIKLLGSSYISQENVQLDIIGTYRLSEVEFDLTKEASETEIAVIGLGKQHRYTRNFLHSNINNIKILVGIELPGLLTDGLKETSHFLQWGVVFQNEFFYDRINDWEKLDSADYSLPYLDDEVSVNYVLKSQNQFTQNNLSLFMQDTYSYYKRGVMELKFTGGIRVRYNDINEEFLYSPRAQLSFKPLNIKKDISFKLAGGMYYQPPFYKERRMTDGSLNFELKSQKSIQIVAGMSYDFTWVNFSNSKMRFISEFYYKSLSDLISYEQDNVHLVYSGFNDAEGYVVGMDFRLNGEFVKGAESWINLSFLRTRESLIGIQHKIWEENEGVDVEDVPRATDQLVALSMFFQDYLPKNEHFKVHVNLNLGTGLPYGQKGNNEIYRNAFRYPPYHRIDLGFSYLLWNVEMKKNRPLHPLRFTKNTWISLEVYNLMAVSNVASVSWIKTYNNYNFAIKNRLTSRRINLKFKIDF